MGRVLGGRGRGRGNKWVATVASIWLQCVVGASYCFGIYSPLLKSSQGYDQSTLDTVAFFKDIGANAGVLAGLLYSSASSAAWGGPWVVLVAGAAQCAAGFLLTWLSVTGFLPSPPVPLMCLYMFLAAHGQTFFNTTDVVVAVQNFPDHRGTIVGIMKGFLGLSGAILIQLYRTVLNGKPSDFLLMLALLPAFLCFLLVYFVKVHGTQGGGDKELLGGFSLTALVTAGYLMVLIICENVLILGSAAHILTFIILLMLLASPLSIVVKVQLQDSRMLLETSCPERMSLIDDDALGGIEQKNYDTLPAENLKHTCKPSSQENIMLPSEENLNLLQAMCTCDFWLLFVAMACGMGSGLATVNNIGQIGVSLGYSSMETSTLVSLWSIWNFLGRFGMGYMSDYFLRLGGHARPLFMAVTLAAMSFGHALISSGFPGALYVGSTLVGVCYGSQWSLMPTITSEIYGIRHFGTIFNAIAAASPFGSYILSVRVVGYIYDMESSSAGVDVCMGRQCFMLSFLIMASVSLFGSIAALALFLRTRMFYRRVIFARLQRSSVA